MRFRRPRRRTRTYRSDGRSALLDIGVLDSQEDVAIVLVGLLPPLRGEVGQPQVGGFRELLILRVGNRLSGFLGGGLDRPAVVRTPATAPAGPADQRENEKCRPAPRHIA